MKISERWLREWVDPGIDTGRLVAQLTAAGMEVESVTPAAGATEQVVVARVLETAPHPEADHLQLCRVDDGSGGDPLQIVCGAPNVVAGMVAPLARIGARLPDGTGIHRSTIRGVESQGMLCSARELGLGDDHDGIISLPADLTVGTDLRDALTLDDMVIDISLTPNRGDCLSIAGIAREVAVLNGSTLTRTPPAPVPAVIDDVLAVELLAADGCPRYLGRVVRGIHAASVTPLWMRERLRRCGVRSISPVVDVTNYVMLELGQPMHAFDLARLEGGIRVRRATDGERLALLDGSEVDVTPGTLLIADHRQAVALAGVMGGAHSAVEEGTRDVFLESAFFAPLAMAGTARGYALHTESSHRFERGVSPAGQRDAIERATALLLQIAGGRPGPVVEACDVAHLPTRPPVALRATRLHLLLGMHIAPDVVGDSLSRLGMQVQGGPDLWQVTPPPFRFDIAIEHDLIEEVARVVGYDKVPARPPLSPLAMRALPESKVPAGAVAAVLVERGYHEVVTFSFVDEKLQSLVDPEMAPLPLANPISADLAVMRTTLWPGLLGTVAYNRKRQQTRVRVFEHALVFRPLAEGLEQVSRIGGAITGTALPEQWGEKGRAVDFFDIKGDVEALLALCGRTDARFEPCTHPALHPGQSARVIDGEEDIGLVGAIHPAVARALKLPAATFVFELRAVALDERPVPRHTAVSRFPSVRRDIALVLDESVSAQVLRDCVGQCGIDVLQNLEFFDLYRGEGIDSGQKSLALSLTFQAPTRTLDDGEVESFVSTIIDSLAKNLGVGLRG